MAKVTYHKSHTYKDLTGKEYNCITQQYAIGVYAILNNDPQLQFNTTPGAVKSQQKKLKKLEDEGKIIDLVLGVPITVSDASGLWEEV